MPYGILKVDTITFTAGGVDTSVSISGLVQNPTFTGGITSTGTISGNIIQGGTTVSGATVTGTAGQFGTLTGNTAGFTTVTGATVTGTVAQFTTITGGTAGFTTVTGTTVTGTTANFATISGATVTGNAGSFTTVTGGVATITSGVFAAGTAALPSISISSDPNTGIFSPGADQLAISTNGTGRLFVDASGRLLVGTSSARSNFQNSSVTCRVQIEGTDYQNTGLAIISNDSSSVQRPVLYLYRNNGSTVGSNTVAVNGDMCGQVIFGANDGSEFVNAATITAEVDGTPGANDMPGRIVLSTTADGASSPTERLRITSAGLVGVGTSSVNTKFEIAGNNDAVTENNTLRFTDTDVSTEANQQIGKIEFYSSDASTPGAGVKAYIGAFAADTTPDAYLAFATQDGSVVSTPVERVRITSEGKVGIGTSSPSRQLSLSDTNPTATFRSTSTTGQCTLFFGDSDSDARGAITYENNGDKLGLWSAGGQKLTIDSSGNVGIGTTGPQGIFQIGTDFGGKRGGSSTDIVIADTTSGVTRFLEFQSASNATRSILFSDATTGNYGSIGYDHSADALVFQSAANERARIDSSGRLLVGTSSAGGTELIQVQGTSGGSNLPGGIALRRSSLGNGDDIGYVNFTNASGNIHAGIKAFADGTPGASDYPGALVFSTTADGASSPTERLRISSNGAFTAVSIYNNTTASAANVVIRSDGVFERSTSSIKYKTDIEDLQDAYADAILNVRPIWYRSTCSSDDPSHSWWGFLAEEVAAVDPRLVHWKTFEVSYNESGSAVNTSCEPEPDGVAYERFVPHLLHLIKRQKEQIEAMEARLIALEQS